MAVEKGKMEHRVSGCGFLVSWCHSVLVPFECHRAFRLFGCFSVLVSQCLGVVVSLCLGVFFLSGCTHSEFNLATGQQETTLYTTEREERIGASVAVQMEQHFKILNDYEKNARLDRILKQIGDICDRRELVYTVKIIDEDDMNAVSLPGGYVYFFRGLMDKLQTDDELAAVIAHEVGHITARHAMKRLQASYGALLLQLGSVAAKEPALAQGVGAAYQTAFLAFSRQDEFQADKLSVKYLQAAGYDPNAIVSVLETLQAEQRKRAPSRIAYFRTHPYVSERIGVVKREIQGYLDFNSYLNLTGQEKDLY